MLQHDPAAKTHDRIGFTLSITIAMHAAIILGVGFIMQIPKAPSAARMDITLSSYESDKPVLDADFVAQTHQEASGSQSTKAEVTTRHRAPINESTIRPIQLAIEIPDQQRKKPVMEVVTTTKASRQKQQHSQEKALKEALEELRGQQERLKRQLELASLQAKLDEEEQVYARLPRVRRATSVATKAAEDAEYLYNWQKRIEKIGNEHYPEIAKKESLYGDVRVLVAIRADGSLKHVEILESSGIPVLDATALKIVRLASPFDPFPPKIRKDTDILEIVRTWQFQKDKFSRMK